jgi:beta-N-acetylhexosaminidase
MGTARTTRRDAHELERLARGCLMASFVGHEAPAWLLDEVAAGLGAVALFTPNIRSDAQTAALVATLRRARPDVVIAVDEEGGDVTRLDAQTGSLSPGNAALGAVDDVEATAAAYRVIGRRLSSLGIDMNLAPCADVNSDPRNPVIGVRSFGCDPGLVARHVRAAIDGLQSIGVAACVKHYPGHGATVDDSHLALPVIDVDVADLRRRELVPFSAAVDAGAASIMTAHIVVSRVDDVPATRSPRTIGMLRDGLDYDGVIVSDALDMAGVHGAGIAAGDVTPEMIGFAAVASLDAGCDLLCLGARQGPDVPAAAVKAIVQAVDEGVLSFRDLVESQRRRARLRHSIRIVDVDHEADASTVESVARRAITGATPGPLRGAVVVDCRPGVSVANFDVAWGLGPDVAAIDPTAIAMDATSDTEANRIVEAARDRPLVVSVRGAAAHRWQQRLVDRIRAQRPDAVIVDLGWPGRPRTATLTTWGASRSSTRAVAEVLCGPDPDG